MLPLLSCSRQYMAEFTFQQFGSFVLEQQCHFQMRMVPKKRKLCVYVCVCFLHRFVHARWVVATDFSIRSGLPFPFPHFKFCQYVAIWCVIWSPVSSFVLQKYQNNSFIDVPYSSFFACIMHFFNPSVDEGKIVCPFSNIFSLSMSVHVGEKVVPPLSLFHALPPSHLSLSTFQYFLDSQPRQYVAYLLLSKISFPLRIRRLRNGIAIFWWRDMD